jgi:hypothetical protein
MYDSEQGFSVLDYHLKQSGGRFDLPQEILSLRLALTARKLERVDYKAPDYEEKTKEASIERNKVFLPLMIRFLTILKEKYPNILEAWQKRHDEDKKNPMMGVSELIEREHIPALPEFEPYIKQLTEMGF